MINTKVIYNTLLNDQRITELVSDENILNAWPDEFDEVFTIDTRTGFEKLIYDEIKRFYKSMKWPAFNPAQNYAVSLYDILGI